MTQHVLILALGPVQGFIAAARRSRDLWSGSWLLSEVSKAAAKALRESVGTDGSLVFPSPNANLEPNSPTAVANKIQALVGDEAERLSGLADKCRIAARDRFRKIAQKARDEFPTADIRVDIWDAQVDDYLEFYAAWAPVDAKADYAAAVENANAALAARKATRNFRQGATRPDNGPWYGLPKSSLDGARETVLAAPFQAPDGQGGRHTTRSKLRLGKSEQLDCAGVIKRRGFDVEQFTPYSRICAQGWIAALADDELARLRAAYEQVFAVPDQDLATRVRGNAGIYAALPCDAQLVYRFRIDTERARFDPGTAERQALDALHQVLSPIWKKNGEPCPYGVILLADGDQMGALLGELHDAPAHIAVTDALSEFAGAVPSFVRQHQGHAIYAGGDDVLAFVPLADAVACAQTLRREFQRCVGSVSTRFNVPVSPTLSVGLAIGHMLEPLGNLRARAGRAEKLAKGDQCVQRRNALGICLGIRSGAEVTVRFRWDDEVALRTFEDWCSEYRARTLSSRVAYDARAVAARTAFAKHTVPGIRQAELVRMLDRARDEQGRKLAEPLRDALAMRAQSLGNLEAFADELVTARWLAARTASDVGDRP